MTVEMKKYRLADIAEIVISSVDKKTKPGEKIVRLCNFTDVYHNWAIKQSDYDSFMVASASDNNINKLSLKKGFVAFTKDSETRDDIGISTYIADDFDDVVLGYHCALAKPNEKIVYGKYLNAFMSSDYIKKYFELNATGSGMRFTLAVSTMEDMPIMLPSLNVQKKIGDMLSDFDKRIENLRVQNRVLEQTAKTIYDYTFLQCAGHQTTYNKILNRNIPADWEVKKLGDLCRIFTGKKDVSKRIPGDYAFFSCAPEKLSSNEYLYDGQAILVSGNGSYTGRVSYYDGKFDLYQRTYACVLKNTSASVMPYLYFTMKYLFEPAYSGGTHGSAIPYIVMNDLTNYSICWNSPAIESFVQRVSPMFKKRLINLKQIEALTTQRNTLLPLLMTGQVEVM